MSLFAFFALYRPLIGPEIYGLTLVPYDELMAMHDLSVLFAIHVDVQAA